MTVTWPNLTEKIEPAHRQALATIATAASRVGVGWFLTGAMARDWIFSLVHGIDTLRATRDADIGIAIAGWGEFEQMRAEIIASGDFLAGRALHRLNHATIRGFHIDLVPFGPLCGDGTHISWPPDQDVIMNVIGFDEAFNAAITVLADSNISVKVASVPGLMLMKLFAWEDRKYLQPGKDAIDINLMLSNYEKVAGRDLWDVAGLMEAEEFNPDRAAARLLGQDVAKIVSLSTHGALGRILDRELNSNSEQLLLEQMQAGKFIRGIRQEDAFETKRDLLASFRAGLLT
jgi:predicted nucleotidyltransferase